MDNNELSGKRVVLCDDEGVIIMVLSRALTRAGLIVVGTAKDGRQCIEIVAREKPDIVLLDFVMPIKNGLEALAEIMAASPTCVVMLTANTEPDHMNKARELGAAGYIAKPISVLQILPALQNALKMFFDCRP